MPVRGSNGNCPTCRWRMEHKQIMGASSVRCHGGPPAFVTRAGTGVWEFPPCPPPPYDFCAAYEDAGSPNRNAVNWAEGQMRINRALRDKEIT